MRKATPKLQQNALRKGKLREGAEYYYSARPSAEGKKAAGVVLKLAKAEKKERSSKEQGSSK